MSDWPARCKKKLAVSFFPLGGQGRLGHGDRHALAGGE